MKSVSNIFNSVRIGLSYIEKASKVLRSVELIGQHLTMLVDDLETVWNIKKEDTETKEV